MSLVGYKKVEVGDTIIPMNLNEYTENVIISEGDSLIGRTIWIFKDSYGPEAGWDVHGYRYILFNDYNCLRDCAYLKTPATILNDTTCHNVRVTDEDGDGYYTWGFAQSKPSILPEWVPEEQDGDDTDYAKGPLNYYGYVKKNIYCPNDTIYINTSTTWDTLRHLFRPVVVRSGVTLTIEGELHGYSNSTITVEEGACLNVSKGTLKGINVNCCGEISLKRNVLDPNPQVRVDRTENQNVRLSRN